MKMFRVLRGAGVAAIASLAIGIGANTAVFSVANALLLQPLPYADPGRLVILWNRSPGLNIQEDWFSTAQYFDIKTSQKGFEQLAIAIGSNFNLTGSGDPERVGVIRVSSNLLPMLGARPEYGQLFVPEDDAPGRPPTAILNHTFWIRRFGGDASMVGKSIVLNGQSYQIAGVLPETFRLPREVMPTLGVAEDGDIFLPLPLPPAAPTTRTREDYNIIGKLKPGVSIASAQAEMDALTSRLRRDFPDAYPPHGGLTFSIVPLLDQVVGTVRRTVVILSTAVAFVLLIACANVANLLLSRALARQREMAIRSALGATRGQIVRQLLGEAVALSVVGAAIGVALAWAGVWWIHAARPANVPRLGEIAINLRVLLFTTGVSIAAGLLAGIVPAFGIRRFDVQRSLAASSRGSAAEGTMWGRGGRLRKILVVSELTFAVVLLVGAGLLIRTIGNLQRVAPGFSPTGVLTFELTFTGQKYANGPLVLQAYRELWDRLNHVSGVSAAGGITSLPLAGLFAWGPITVEGRIPPPGENFINADQRIAAGRYFDAMGIPLRRGRLFNDTDTADAPRVVIVDEFMAQQLWPNEDPIGKRIRFGDLKSTNPWQTVVGVVGRVKQYGLDTDGRIAVYMPHTQATARALYVAVRSSSAEASVEAAVRQQVRELDPNLPIYRMRPMSALVAGSMATQRFAMQILGAFALVALALAAIGIHAVMGHVVAQGTREIGIRVALGASGRGILAMVLRHGLTLAVLGIGLGLIGAAGLTRLMRSLIFGVGVVDPLTYVAVAGAFIGVALVATIIPAWRASRVDPVISLRAE